HGTLSEAGREEAVRAAGDGLAVDRDALDLLARGRVENGDVARMRAGDERAFAVGRELDADRELRDLERRRDRERLRVEDGDRVGPAVGHPDFPAVRRGRDALGSFAGRNVLEDLALG